ncbi:hypothetical protein GCM10009718_02140 [Isoptericola halotolerans]|uniref:Uncharacterized membrane protein HdeD (DUF308 family) n=1 Tax=Isoptericola halotolerans TaxID=300560 RepID=A0ABX2A240_9MICO|nr:DUF308 domain-containing protein [Isoptericola halotolerans]NOV96859.1 uncharacterized membrane protein HdeD (DUF308 family) [Isoptericola halotolerans]
MARAPQDAPEQADPATPTARNPFRRVWWLPVVRGTAFIVLGLLLMIEPLGELEVLRLLLGAFLVLDAVLVAVQWFVHRQQVGSAWWLAQTGVNVLFGVAVAFWPDLSATPLYYVLAAWTIVLGIVTVVGGSALARNRDLGWPWMLSFGITAGLFGLLLVTRPLDSFDVLRLVTVVFALFAFVAGAVHIVSGFAVRSVSRELWGLREQAEKVGVVVTGGSVLGAANPQVGPAAATGPVPAAGEGGATRATDEAVSTPEVDEAAAVPEVAGSPPSASPTTSPADGSGRERGAD